MTEQLVVPQWPDEATRTPEKSCYWIAETVIGSKAYSARSRYGAPNELARVLVAANIGDMEVKAETAGLRGYALYRSLYEMARWTHQETATSPLRRIPYARVEVARERARKVVYSAQNRG